MCTFAHAYIHVHTYVHTHTNTHTLIHTGSRSDGRRPPFKLVMKLEEFHGVVQRLTSIAAKLGIDIHSDHNDSDDSDTKNCADGAVAGNGPADLNDDGDIVTNTDGVTTTNTNAHKYASTLLTQEEYLFLWEENHRFVRNVLDSVIDDPSYITEAQAFLELTVRVLSTLLRGHCLLQTPSTSEGSTHNAADACMDESKSKKADASGCEKAGDNKDQDENNASTHTRTYTYRPLVMHPMMLEGLARIFNLTDNGQHNRFYPRYGINRVASHAQAERFYDCNGVYAVRDAGSTASSAATPGDMETNTNTGFGDTEKSCGDDLNDDGSNRNSTRIEDDGDSGESGGNVSSIPTPPPLPSPGTVSAPRVGSHAHVSSFLFRNINVFGRARGFQYIKDRLLDTDTETGGTFLGMAALIKILACCAPYLHQQWSQPYVSSLSLPSLISQRLALITDDELKV